MILKGFAAFGLASLVLAFRPNPQTRRFIVCLIASYMFVTFAKTLTQRILGNNEVAVNQAERERIEMALKVEELVGKLEELERAQPATQEMQSSTIVVQTTTDETVAENYEYDFVIPSFATTNVVEGLTNQLEVTAFVMGEENIDFRTQWQADALGAQDELGLLASTNLCFEGTESSFIVACTRIPENCQAIEFSLPRIALPEEWDIRGVAFKLMELLDSDGDGILDYTEVNYCHTDPNNPDFDDDGINDGDEILIGTLPNVKDSDGDGLDDGQELQFGSNPRSMYSKGGIIDDYTAYVLGLDPIDPDTDGDGVSDIDEMRGRGVNYTNPLKRDSDGDGLSDGMELYILGTDANNVDTDGDGLSDYLEVRVLHTYPTVVDTDGDNISDYLEWIIGTSATNATSKASLCTNIYGNNYDTSTGQLFEFSHNIDVNVTYTGEAFDSDYAVFGLHAPEGGHTTSNSLDFEHTGPSTSYHNAFVMTFTNGLFKALRTGWYRFRINVDDSAYINIGGTTITDDYYTDGIGAPGAYAEKLMVAGREYPVSGVVTNVGGPAKLEFARYVTYSPTDRVQCSASFSKPFVMCASHTNEPMSPEQQVFLRVSAKGGDFGGRMTFRSEGLSKLNGFSVNGLDTNTLPPYLDVAANSTVNLLVSYKGALPSSSLNDVKLIAEFEEFQTGYTSVSTAAVTVVKAAMYADYDRDGDIDSTDKNAWARGKKLRHWVNTNDANNNVVDGEADMLDFVPVRLDIKDLLDLLGENPNNDYRFRIEGPSNVVNCVWTSIVPSAANSFQYTSYTNAGPALNAAVSSAQVATTNQDMSLSFVNHLKNSSVGGVFLIEGKSPSYDPLIFACYRRSDNAVVARVRMPMQISYVEDMYRWINLRSICGDNSGERTNRCVPDNFPDEESDDKHYIFVHGYNVSASSARNWGNEFFKRLWQSGSKSMFTAVDWYGDDSRKSWPVIGNVTPNYYVNVKHALDSAESLKWFAEMLPGTKCLIAHSLGNMLVSHAICNCGMGVVKYYMLNAAVPIEAYDASSVNANDRMLMTHPDWQMIATRFRSTHWYQLFDSSDSRSSLTWKNMFGNLTNSINMYSTQEEVLMNSDGVLHTVFSPNYAWANQELRKGVWPMLLPGNNEAGWSFNSAYDIDAVELGLLSDSELRTKPLFGRFDAKYMCQTNAITYRLPNLHQVLGDGIPAESFAAGSNPIPRFTNSPSCDNINMVGLLPQGSNEAWGHSYIYEGTYRATRGVFNIILEKRNETQIP